MTDHDLQALLSGETDAAALDARLDAEARTSLDAYRDVFAVLGTPPDGFAPGFADRVAAAVEARAPRRAPFPWTLVASALAAILAAVALRTEALWSVLERALPGASVPEPFVGAAAPYVALALVLLTITEALDVLRRRGAQPS